MDTFTLLDELQTIARNGLLFAENGYDRERYTRLLQLATSSYAEILDMPSEDVQARFRQELGYITPKVGADAAVFNQQGEILLVDRADGGGWCLPCGWVEPNESPAEGALRELHEEAGLEAQVISLVGVFTRKAGLGYGPHTMISVVHLCEITGGELRISHESLEARYWGIEAVPRWHANHETLARAARHMWMAGECTPAVSA